MLGRAFFGGGWYGPRYFGAGGEFVPPVDEPSQGGGWLPPPRPRRSRAELDREQEERWLAKQRQDRELEDELAGIYDRLHGLTLPPAEAEAVAAEVATAVAPFVEERQGRVDWSALIADAQAVETMLQVAKRLRIDARQAETNELLTILLLAS